MDFSSEVSSVVFKSFQLTQFVPVSIIDDQIVEGDEIFEASLETGSLTRGVVISSDATIITILENDCKFIIHTLHNLIHHTHT